MGRKESNQTNQTDLGRSVVPYIKLTSIRVNDRNATSTNEFIFHGTLCYNLVLYNISSYHFCHPIKMFSLIIEKIKN